MAWKGGGYSPPPKGCSHAYQMQYQRYKAWCGDCGVSWRLDEKKGWRYIPISQVKFGEEVYGDPW